MDEIQEWFESDLIDLVNGLPNILCPPNQIIPKLVNSMAFHPDIFDKHFIKNIHTFDVFYAESRSGHRIACVFRRYKPDTKLTILYSHSNVADLGYLSQFLWILCLKTKCNVLSYDYSGYGLSTGQPSEDNLYADIDATLSALIYLHDIWPKDIVLFGESLGSVPTIDLSARLCFRGAIIDSAILSGLRTIYPKLSTRMWAFDPLNNLSKADKIKCKVLVMHGSEDELTDIKDAILLRDRCPHKVKPFWAKGFGHNGPQLHPKYYDRIHTFIHKECH